MFHKAGIFARNRKLLGLIGIALFVVAVLLYQLWSVAEKTISSVNEAKRGRTTTAIVKAKEHVRFDEKNHSYIGSYGQPVEAAPGTEQWRVYFQIENFDQVPEPKRTQLMHSEEARIRKFGLRFYTFSAPEKAFYDKTEIGDKLEVLYRYMGDEKEIINIRNLTQR